MLLKYVFIYLKTNQEIDEMKTRQMLTCVSIVIFLPRLKKVFLTQVNVL